jgi:hypothetical protein
MEIVPLVLRGTTGGFDYEPPCPEIVPLVLRRTTGGLNTICITTPAQPSVDRPSLKEGEEYKIN